MAGSIARNIVRRGKRIVRALAGQDVLQYRQVKVATEVHGTGYGAWSVCPDGIDAHSVVYSFGVGEDVSFDLSLIARYGVVVHAFDPTPRSVAWVRHQDLPEAFRFYDVGVADFDGTATFRAPEDPAHVSYAFLGREEATGGVVAARVHRLDTIMEQLGHDHVDLLKLDIEGAEYGVIEAVTARRLDVRQLLVEFHHRFAQVGVERTKAAIRLLNEHGYRIFAVSPGGEEYAFIRI